MGSANYAARVWVNGTFVGEHEGGHLPFAFDVSAVAPAGRPVTVAIRVENVLKPTRVPAGNLPPGARSLFNSNPPATFDFFPYAGLHRAVVLDTVLAALGQRYDEWLAGGLEAVYEGLGARDLLQLGCVPNATAIAARNGQGGMLSRPSDDEDFLMDLGPRKHGTQPKREQ